MAQWRKTFDSLGGPTYIADPRVDEQARLGELLLARQRLAGDQQDRLFGRRQQLEQDQTRLAEGRRQFDMELAQRQAEAKQRADMTAAEAARAQANADRAFGLDQKQAGLAETRQQFMERQAIEQAAREAAAAQESTRRFDVSEAGDQQRFDATQRASREQERMRQLEQIRRDALQQASQAGAQEFAARESMRDREGQVLRDKAAADRAAADRASAEKRQDQKLAQARDLDKQDRADERAKIEGTQEQQQAAAIQARAARFRAALVNATAKGSLTENDQAKAVREAYAAATSPDLDPQRITRERMMLGPDGEAAANAELLKIVEELFPRQDYVANTGDMLNGPGDVAKALFALPLLAAEHPDFLNRNDYTRAFATWLARKLEGGAGVENRSAAQNEAGRLFGKPKSSDERRTTSRR